MEVLEFESVKLFEEISDSDVRKVLNEAGADIENIMKNNIAIDKTTAMIRFFILQPSQKRLF